MTPGRLLLAATPLGQPADASPRLREALAGADVVAAEDTRRLRILAKQLEVTISGRVVSLYDQVEASRAGALVEDVAGGATVLVVSDAGMPLISDPGYRLVTACVAAGVPVSCLPGPSAVTTALAVSGVAAEKFCFEGFAPRKKSARRTWLAGLATEQRACVFFESPRRLADCLGDAVDLLGASRQAAVCRELTKVHEEVVRGMLGALADWSAGGVLGEITVVLAGASALASDSDSAELIARLVGEVEHLVDAGARVKDACGLVAADNPPVRPRQLYEAVLHSRDSGSR